MTKRVLITGISSKIGEAITIKYSENGWNIIGHYNSGVQNVEKLHESLNKTKAQIEFVQADFTQKEDVERFLQDIKKREIAAYIGNAGTAFVKKHYTEISIEEINQTFMVNVFVPIKIIAKVFKGMCKNKFGRIVNISSIAAKYGGSENTIHYGASKRALEGVTKTFAREGSTDNILVNTVRPGFIDTDFHIKFPKNINERISKIPMKRIGSPFEIAEIVYYLGSEKNTYITNETITIAGGE